MTLLGRENGTRHGLLRAVVGAHCVEGNARQTIPFVNGGRLLANLDDQVALVHAIVRAYTVRQLRPAAIGHVTVCGLDALKYALRRLVRERDIFFLGTAMVLSSSCLLGVLFARCSVCSVFRLLGVPSAQCSRGSPRDRHGTSLVRTSGDLQMLRTLGAGVSSPTVPGPATAGGLRHRSGGIPRLQEILEGRERRICRVGVAGARVCIQVGSHTLGKFPCSRPGTADKGSDNANSSRTGPSRSISPSALTGSMSSDSTNPNT